MLWNAKVTIQDYISLEKTVKVLCTCRDQTDFCMLELGIEEISCEFRTVMHFDQYCDSGCRRYYVK